MDISIKYKIINSQDDRILNEIRSPLKIENEVDFWDTLSLDDKSSIQEGLDELNEGKHVSHESVKKEIKNRFNF